MASVILGDWTHRRGDAGGARAVPAEIDRPRPVVAWSWRPEHGGRVDQVRVAGTTVLVATMMPRDPKAPRWEHAVVYVLDAHTGIEIARRVLPDPVPVAAMVVDDGIVHVVSTRKGEPIFWYALTPAELVPCHRRIVAVADGLQHDDVLDAWATPDGGLWLELDAAVDAESERVRSFAFADPDGAPVAQRVNEGRFFVEGPPVAHDACAGGHELFVPMGGRWSGETDSAPPGISRLDRGNGFAGAEAAWVSATVVGPRSRIHALGGDGVVCAVAVAEDHVRPDHARIEVFAVDRTSGVVRWRAHDDRLAIKPSVGAAARVARRPNGEVLFQSLGPDGTPCTPLICARPDGRLDSIVLGARGRYVLDAALGDLVLAHRENKDGRVEVGGFAIDLEGRLLGRRAVPRWTIDLGDLGGAATVYAGAGAVVVRGARSVSAVRM
jgi:outer membrane protein assembly factor BamB